MVYNGRRRIGERQQSGLARWPWATGTLGLSRCGSVYGLCPLDRSRGRRVVLGHSGGEVRGMVICVLVVRDVGDGTDEWSSPVMGLHGADCMRRLLLPLQSVGGGH